MYWKKPRTCMMGMPDTASVLLICKVIPSSVWADGSNRLYAAALPLNVFFDVGRDGTSIVSLRA
jgi:hypothetical protein